MSRDLKKVAARQAKQLRHLRDLDARKDRAAIQEIRMLLLGKFKEDAEFWYGEAKELASSATKEDMPRVRMVTAMLGKVLSDQRETDMSNVKQPKAVAPPRINILIGGKQPEPEKRVTQRQDIEVQSERVA